MAKSELRDQIQRVNRQVAGALHSALTAHGTIGRRNVGSASKRVASQLVTNVNFNLPAEDIQQRLVQFIAEKEALIVSYRHHMKRCGDKEMLKGLQIKHKAVLGFVKQLKHDVLGKECLELSQRTKI